ncbi:hypothetical protein N9J24_03055 [Bacteroidia bacterium]|nr:hypothetical protein [Bacteroidia bacterium]
MKLILTSFSTLFILHLGFSQTGPGRIGSSDGSSNLELRPTRFISSRDIIKGHIY